MYERAWLNLVVFRPIRMRARKAIDQLECRAIVPGSAQSQAAHINSFWNDVAVIQYELN